MMTRHLALIAGLASSLITCIAAWETQEQAAQQVRTLLSSPHEHQGVGVLSTLYLPGSDSLPSAPPPPLSGHEYFCPTYPNGDLTFIALPVSQNWRNALSHTPNGERVNVSFAVASNPDPAVPDARHLGSQGEGWDPKRPSWRRGMPSKLRFTLFGHMETLNSSLSASASASSVEEVRSAFLRCHPDAAHWAPGAKDSPHQALWVRFVVEKIYAVGGFGDEHRIGWIDRDVYAKAGREGHGEGGKEEAVQREGGETATEGEMLSSGDALFAVNAEGQRGEGPLFLAEMDMPFCARVGGGGAPSQLPFLAPHED